MNKKSLGIIVLILLISLILGVIFISFGPKDRKDELPKIIIAGNFGYLLSGEWENFFKKEGLQIEYAKEYHKRTAEGVTLALLQGEIDYVLSYGHGSSFFIKPSLKGAPIKTVMLLDAGTPISLIANPEIKKLDDLKSVGVYPLYSPYTLYYPIRKFIEDHNLEKVEIVEPENQHVHGLYYLLIDNEVDAIFVHSGQAYELQKKGFHILDTFTELQPASLIVRNDKIERNPEELQKVIKALEQTINFIIDNPEKLKKNFLEEFNLDKEDIVLLTSSMENFVSYLISSFETRRYCPVNEGAKLLIQITKAEEFKTIQEVEKQVVTQEELDKVFDFRFVR